MRIGLEGRLGLMVVKPKSLLPWRVVAVVLALSSISAGVLLTTAGVAFASTTGWVRLCNSVSCKLPPALSDTTMVYDAATKQVILFGGYGYGVQSPAATGTSTGSTSSANGAGPKSITLDQTWTWNGSTWTQAHPAKSPPALADVSLAYDASSRQVVLFGGRNAQNKVMAQTWTWNGSTWTQAHPVKSPPALADVSLAYDASSRQVVLFGGYGQSVSLSGNLASLITGPPSRQTWTWNGSTWTQAHPAKSPPALYGGSMAYDASSKRVVLFGGSNASGPIDSTWTWNGSTWTQAHPAKSPPARMDASMAYDASSRQVVLFGGSTYGGTFLNDTWTWNGSTWTQGSSASASGTASSASGGSVTSPTLFPSSTSSASSGASPGITGRSYAPAAYYAPAKQVVLFGGYAYVSYDRGMWGYSFSTAHPAGALEPGVKQSSSVSGKSTWNVVIGAVLIVLASIGLVTVSALWIIRRRRARRMVA
ncbi:MAG: kelch motif-containing protein [Actinobacteria bacterium]|nr:kelch motif-containing protein [Actinomycetota bacterium]